MTLIPTLAMALAAAPAAPAQPAAHSVSVAHPAGAAAAEYRGEVDVRHRQVGSAGPGGRPSTLRCTWTASMEVNRTATTAAGTLAARSFVQDNVASGSRPGWCSANRAAIARDVASRLGDASRHLASAAAADRGVLLADLDRLAQGTPGN